MLYNYSQIPPAFYGSLCAFLSQSRLIIQKFDFKEDKFEILWIAYLQSDFANNVQFLEWSASYLAIANSGRVHIYANDCSFNTTIHCPLEIASIKWIFKEYLVVFTRLSLCADIWFISPTSTKHILRITDYKSPIIKKHSNKCFYLLTRVNTTDYIIKVSLSGIESSLNQITVPLVDTAPELWTIMPDESFVLTENPAIAPKVLLLSSNGQVLTSWIGPSVTHQSSRSSDYSIINTLDICYIESHPYIAVGAENSVTLLSQTNLQPVHVMLHSKTVDSTYYFVDCWELKDNEYKFCSLPYNLIESKQQPSIIHAKSSNTHIAIVCSTTPTTCWIWRLTHNSCILDFVLTHKNSITGIDWHVSGNLLIIGLDSCSVLWNLQTCKGKFYNSHMKFLDGAKLCYSEDSFDIECFDS